MGAGPTREEVIAEVEPIAALNARVANARQEGLDLLAPQGLAATERALNDAIAAARRGNENEAVRLAREGAKRLDQAERESARAAEALRSVLEQRRRAVDAGAPELLTKRFEELDQSLRSAATMAEKGNIDDAKDAGSRLLEAYSTIELDALKVDATDLAKDALKAAQAAGAERHAGATFSRARKELDLAIGILEADRSAVSRANVHARRAADLAARSQHIAELVKDFGRRGYDQEQIVLWYQDQLEEVSTPLGDELEFDRPNHMVVAGLRGQIRALVDGHAETQAELVEARERIKDLQVASTVTAESQREAEARYDRIQSMFSEDEATVYRQGLNVLLETHGFEFPVGESEIRSSNFPLLNRIAKAINEFPNPNVVVSGHTDSSGDTEFNQKLSEDRARRVADFLVEVTGIARERVTTRGFGKSKPVASNETAEGRARNRRIEILILNR